MSTIFKTRISQQEVQTPVVYTSTIATEELNANHLRGETIESPEVWAGTLNANKVLAANSLNIETVTDNLTVHNDVDARGDVLVSSGNVLVAKGGAVSFVDDGEVVDENGASGFPVLSGIPYVLNNSTIYNLGEITEDVNLSAIHFSGNDKMVQTCEIWFSIGDEAHDIYWPENMLWLDSADGNAPAIVVRTEYRVVIRKEENGSMVASIAYAVGEGREIVSGNMMEGVARLDADNTFSAGNTFTGEVDMSTASVTPPSGWNVADLTPEAIQAVVPMAWGAFDSAPSAPDEKTLAIGNGAVAKGGASVVIGNNASSNSGSSVAIGVGATTKSHFAIAVGAHSSAEYTGASVGHGAKANSDCVAFGLRAIAASSNVVTIGADTTSYKSRTVTIGGKFTETTPDGDVTHTCTTEGTGSITIGAGANTLNSGDTESSNSVTIGCKAENKGADSVVIGAGASGNTAGSVVMGAGAKAKANGGKVSVAIGKNADALAEYGIAIGGTAKAYAHSSAVGIGANASGTKSLAFGDYTTASAYQSTAIGSQAKAADRGVVAFRSTAEDGTYTQLYFSGANTPLANTYENGEAMMGYVVRDSAGNIMTDAEGNAMVGTQKLSVLFPNNRGENAFTPAALGLDDEWTPKPMFRPSDLDMPQEEPTEPEEYQPLPVYPIVEPEIEEI